MNYATRYQFRRVVVWLTVAYFLLVVGLAGAFYFAERNRNDAERRIAIENCERGKRIIATAADLFEAVILDVYSARIARGETGLAKRSAALLARVRNEIRPGANRSCR